MRDKGYETRNETKRNETKRDGETKRRIVHFFHHTPHTTLANQKSIYLSPTHQPTRQKLCIQSIPFGTKTRRRVKREGIDHNRIVLIAAKGSRVTNVQRGKRPTSSHPSRTVERLTTVSESGIGGRDREARLFVCFKGSVH